MISVALQPALGRASTELERGQAAAAIAILSPLLQGARKKEDEWAVRASLAEAHVQHGDLATAATVLGRTPDSLREPLPPVLQSSLWRLHGRLAYARGDQSRAIALHGRALKHAEVAHDSRAIGRARLELALCYMKVADSTIVRDHITEAAAALHAAGDRRNLALVHSLSGRLLAVAGRFDEAQAALNLAERQAASIDADDVLAGVLVNQANVALMRHRHPEALRLAERAVSIQDAIGHGHGLSVALATLGQICVRLGDLARAETVLHRALEVRGTVQFHETTGAVYDTLAQMALTRGDYEAAAEHLQQAATAYGAYGRQTHRWYEWSIKVIAARLAVRRSDFGAAIELADAIASAPDAPSPDALQAALIAVEAALAAGTPDEAATRLSAVEVKLDPRGTPTPWAEFLRVRGQWRAAQGQRTDAYHDIAQSASVFDIVGERYQAGVSHRTLGELIGTWGPPQVARDHFDRAIEVFTALGAARDLLRAQRARSQLPSASSEETSVVLADADEALVRRLVNAAAMPELLARELTAAVIAGVGATLAALVIKAGDQAQMLAVSGGDETDARRLMQQALGDRRERTESLYTEFLGQQGTSTRTLVVRVPTPLTPDRHRRLRMMCSVARQGFELCTFRDRPVSLSATPGDGRLEPLLPGLICVSAVMHRVVDQIQRLRGNDLTVLVTGESGTGKELIARAIHEGSSRQGAGFLPYNCTTTTRELADSQLFGHRRGAFTGAFADQRGLIRSAAGGTLFLDEVGDLPLDVQPKLLRFLEQAEVMPVGDTRPQKVDVRVVAATNADLDQRVAEGRFREDLYYRLSVIRIHVPPLRQRREEIPHLTTFFLRESTERLAKPGVTMSPDVLERFAQYWWPGNVRQLRNEVQRAVALAAEGGVIGPELLSTDLSTTERRVGMTTTSGRPQLRGGQTLGSAVDDLERELIRDMLSRQRGNISESARALGLTRRGLYLKLRRLGLDTLSEVHT